MRSSRLPVRARSTEAPWCWPPRSPPKLSSLARIPAIFGAALGADGPGWRTRQVKSFGPTRIPAGLSSINSEIVGNSTEVAISNAYYPDIRSASDSVTKLGIQIGADMASNVLKEFWPDVNRKFRHRQSEWH
jgi:hypothetical protein